MMNPKPTSVEEYFSWFTPGIQAKLQQIRETLRDALPEAKEVISYHMPAFKTTEVLVYFAAAKSHLGYYPTNSGVQEFKKELAELRQLAKDEDHTELASQIYARIEAIEHSFGHLGQELQHHDILNAVEFFQGRKKELQRMRGIDIPKWIDFYNN